MPQEYIPYDDKKKNNKYKLTKKDKEKIKKIKKENPDMSNAKIGKKFGVSRERVRQLTTKTHENNTNKQGGRKKREAELNRIYMQRYRLRKKILGFTSTSPENFKRSIDDMEREYNRLGEELEKRRKKRKQERKRKKEEEKKENK